MQNNLIVYLPGYSGMPPAKLNPLLRRFSQEGFDTLSINYKNFGRGDITDTAKRVNRVIHPLKGKYDWITLIGHSMGGLVARKMLCQDISVADSLITLGSPHRGTQAASRPFWWLGGKAVGQMQSASKFLAYLGWPQKPTLTVTAKWDVLVPDGSWPLLSEYEKAHVSNIQVPGGHLGLILSSRVFGEIYSWLQYEVIDELPSEETGTINEV